MAYARTVRAPALGIAVHATVAGVTLAGVAMAGVAIGLMNRNVPVPFYSYAVPAAAVATVLLVVRAWRRRRWPFDGEPHAPPLFVRLLAAAFAGGGCGAYVGLLSDWVYDVSMDLVWFTLLPICVAACGGRGLVRGLACLVALHLGAELGAQMGYGHPFGLSWTVTRNHLPYLPASFGGLLAWELLLRRVRERFEPRAVATDQEAAPRRAR
jgi:hypothetical protein